jgi:hypothetical protein
VWRKGFAGSRQIRQYCCKTENLGFVRTNDHISRLFAKAKRIHQY